MSHTPPPCEPCCCRRQIRAAAGPSVLKSPEAALVHLKIPSEARRGNETGWRSGRRADEPRNKMDHSKSWQPCGGAIHDLYHDLHWLHLHQES
ncbi:hypothetical protein E2C01_025038 [Portunus trituberculatus]|uniref:Uncharacterized protein n=1 Tax=Portunus trituberculatus TaxID=210409 RepID=A0A5B7EC88_PORTR|nr:hypothetical protein [Portunus trituberculatus]